VDECTQNDYILRSSILAMTTVSSWQIAGREFDVFTVEPEVIILLARNELSA